MVEQLVWQRTFRGPNVCFWVVALEAVRVLDDVVAIQDASTCDVDLAVDHCSTVMHSSLLQVLTLEEFVGFGVVGNHSRGVPWRLDGW